MPRRLNPLTERRGPGRSLQKISVAKLAVKVRKNTTILNSRELYRIRIDMDSTPDTTAVMQYISAVPEGVGAGNRSGKKIRANHVSIRGSIIKLGASGGTQVRLILFRDNLGSTTPPTLGDLFSDENDFHENKHMLISEQVQKRFTIMWDKFIILNENFDGETTAAQFKFSKKLNFNILFTGAASTNEGKNSLWLLSGSNETNVPLLNGDVVFKYSDL